MSSTSSRLAWEQDIKKKGVEDIHLNSFFIPSIFQNASKPSYFLSFKTGFLPFPLFQNRLSISSLSKHFKAFFHYLALFVEDGEIFAHIPKVACHKSFQL